MPRINGPDWVWTLPDVDAWDRLRSGETLSQADRYHLSSCLETLDHILCHPAGTESVIAQLRVARRIASGRT